ncbi:hypothetical protein [Sorangium sp. So ce1000]|uniref:hypothetical protein n=1 Tax=Sorangium sp. So ce1000 TaxID=3133325 RepID=UPI003F5DDF7A
MSERRSQVDDFTRLTEEDFTRLTEETERLAKHVEDLRLRIAATTAKRRASSGTLPAQSAALFAPPNASPSERPHHGPPSERPYEAVAQRSHEAAAERSHEAAAERPHDATSERPYDATPERPYEAAAERPHDATAERPHRAPTDRPAPRHSPFPERPSCLENVSRWLPPLKTARETMESGVHERVTEAGRYCIITPRTRPNNLPAKRRSPKSDVA